MKLSKTIGLATVATAALAMTSCSSGPKQISRTWDDWVNQKYSENSVIHGLVLQDILPVYPIVGFFASFADIIALNPYYFWSRDIWEGNGTAYVHDEVDGAQNSVGTLIESGD